MNKTEIFAVAGNPISHSISPQMFQKAFNIKGVNAIYIRFAATEISEIIDTVRELNIKGINITSPFKEEIIPLLDAIDNKAAAIGAVNTVINRDGKLIGYNTDYMGVSLALGFNGVKKKNRKAVIVGAGGAARSAAFCCVNAGYDTVIVNRTYAKACNLAQQFLCRARPLEEISQELFSGDTVILCLPKMINSVQKCLFKENLTILNANYNQDTNFSDLIAKSSNFIDGKKWLLFQGSESFRLFTGHKPPLKEMSDVLSSMVAVSRKSNIVFIGFMGAGKSTIGFSFAERSSMTFIDLDSFIEERAMQSIGEIFKEKGEAIFRDYEKEALQEVLNGECLVIATGGGSIIEKKNLEKICANSLVVWLFSGIKETLMRIDGKNSRPLITGRKSFKKLFAERMPLYAQASHFLIRTDRGGNIDEISKRILYESDNAFRDQWYNCSPTI